MKRTIEITLRATFDDTCPEDLSPSVDSIAEDLAAELDLALDQHADNALTYGIARLTNTEIVCTSDNDTIDPWRLLREVIGDDDPRTFQEARQWCEKLGMLGPHDQIDIVVMAGTIRTILDKVRGQKWRSAENR